MSQEMRYPKFGVPVRIAMVDGTLIIGMVFVRQNQRVIDVVCDVRNFFPIKTNAGVSLLNKQHAVQIHLLSIEEIIEKIDLFPEVDIHYLRNNSW